MGIIEITPLQKDVDGAMGTGQESDLDLETGVWFDGLHASSRELHSSKGEPPQVVPIFGGVGEVKKKKKKKRPLIRWIVCILEALHYSAFLSSVLQEVTLHFETTATKNIYASLSLSLSLIQVFIYMHLRVLL